MNLPVFCITCFLSPKVSCSVVLHVLEQHSPISTSIVLIEDHLVDEWTNLLRTTHVKCSVELIDCHKQSVHHAKVTVVIIGNIPFCSSSQWRCSNISILDFLLNGLPT